MQQSSGTRGKTRPSFVQRLRRNTVIVLLFATGVFALVSYFQQSRVRQQAASENDRQEANDTENEDGLGSPSYKTNATPSPPAPLPATGEGSKGPSRPDGEIRNPNDEIRNALTPKGKIRNPNVEIRNGKRGEQEARAACGCSAGGDGTADGRDL